jgi:formylglycine-generating enzyme required for sulfatase activity
MKISYKDKVNESPRKRTLLAIPVATLLAALALTGATAYGISIDTVTIGDPGNAGDTVRMADDGGTTGYGSVPYTYEIGTTEVTNSQYAAFLNAVDSNGANALGLYNISYMSGSSYGGITWNGSSGQYEVKAGYEPKPVNFVSIYDAMRFANWLTNGATAGASTETGVYTLSGGSEIPGNPTVGRNLTVNGTTLTGTGDLAGVTGTVWAIASENEWYKAAFYNVSSGEYSLYPNGTDTISGSDANYYGSGNGNSMLDVGKLSKEQNGTYDMGGNVGEWTDSLVLDWDGSDISGNVRVVRGSSFLSPSARAESSGRNYGIDDAENSIRGFRVVSLTVLAAIPEPDELTAMAGLVILIVGTWIRLGRGAARQSG